MNWEWIEHNSHDSKYRFPFGAVTYGTTIELRLKVSSNQNNTSVTLRLNQNGKRTKDIPMELEINSFNERIFKANIVAPHKSGLMWYYFIIVVGGHVYYYGNNHHLLGGQGITQEQVPPSYQITVYDPNAEVPKWFREGIVYQIFVDRFFNGYEDHRILNPKKGCLLHGTWEDTPIYIRHPANGSILRWDFFGGNLLGIIKKLPYLKELGITVLYLNPIFEAVSNHKYDTGNYKVIDPMFGTNDVFNELCKKAKENGISIILDGVFSHTGSDSIYFNKDGNYPNLGAYQSTESPYYSWYRFYDYPEKYECWWGIDLLPNVDELNKSYQDYIIFAEDSVISHWMRLGAMGWRLDVADELPDEFIKNLRSKLKEQNPEHLLLGEVWEDATNKISYGITREYLWGKELDSVTNYPFRNILIDFLLGKHDASHTHKRLMSLYENYPQPYFYSNFNLLGSHDVPRILTILGGAPDEGQLTEQEKAVFSLRTNQRKLGISRLKLFVLIQMTFPGVPCIYYGDESGMEGYSDPFNRGPFPWGKEDKELLEWYKIMISIRKKYPVMVSGDWYPISAAENVLTYLRIATQQQTDCTALIVINRNAKQSENIVLNDAVFFNKRWISLINGNNIEPDNSNQINFTLAPLEGQILIEQER